MPPTVTSQPLPSPPPSYNEATSEAQPPPYPVVTAQPTSTIDPHDAPSELMESVVPTLEAPPETDEEEEERRRRREEQCCCDPYDPVEDDLLTYLLCRLCCSGCRYCCIAIGECTDGCCNSCAGCIHDCCEPSNNDNDCCECDGCCDGEGCCEGDGCCDGDAGCCDGDIDCNCCD